MLGQVDVEVDGGVEDGEEVGYLAHLLHPGRPGHILLSKISNMGQSYKEMSSPTNWGSIEQHGTE